MLLRRLFLISKNFKAKYNKVWEIFKAKYGRKLQKSQNGVSYLPRLPMTAVKFSNEILPHIHKSTTDSPNKIHSWFSMFSNKKHASNFGQKLAYKFCELAYNENLEILP